MLEDVVAKLTKSERCRLSLILDKESRRDRLVQEITAELNQVVREIQLRKSDLAQVNFAEEPRYVEVSKPLIYHRDDHTKTWNGRGRRPKWLTEFGVPVSLGLLTTGDGGENGTGK